MGEDSPLGKRDTVLGEKVSNQQSTGSFQRGKKIKNPPKTNKQTKQKTKVKASRERD